MRIPAYITEERMRMLHASALTWIGTPFVPHAGIKGAGVDCVSLAVCIYAESGFAFPYEPPPYTLDGGDHLAESKIAKWIEGSGRFDLVTSAREGDAILFRIGKVEHHAGVKVTASTFIHAIRGHGVIESNLGDPTWASRRGRVYRPMEGD